MVNSIFFKLVNGKLIPAEEKEVDFLDGSEVMISFHYVKEDNDLAINFWASSRSRITAYSIGITYDEFMQLHEQIKDKQSLIDLIVARRV